MLPFKVPGEHIYNGLVMSRSYPAAILDRIPDFEFRPDDVVVDTYPKSGTTWIQHIVLLILSSADTDSSRKVPLNERSKFLEFALSDIPNIDILAQLQCQRIIKSHLPYGFFKNAIENRGKDGFKIIIGMRNVKDVLVSYYHHYRMNDELGRFQEDFSAFFNLFKEKRLVHGDYFDHVLSWWKERHNSNIYFVKYEDLNVNRRGEIAKIAAFLGKELTESELDIIDKEASFKEMKNNPSTNKHDLPHLHHNISEFIRKGEVGDWKNYFTEEQIQYIDRICKEQLIARGLELRDI